MRIRLRIGRRVGAGRGDGVTEDCCRPAFNPWAAPPPGVSPVTDLTESERAEASRSSPTTPPMVLGLPTVGGGRGAACCCAGSLGGCRGGLAKGEGALLVLLAIGRRRPVRAAPTGVMYISA
jgi:hypothetical protein